MEYADDDDEPIARAPAFYSSIDDEDEPLPPPVPASHPAIPFPPAPPRTTSVVFYDDDDDDDKNAPSDCLPRESPKRLCSSGDLVPPEHTSMSSSIARLGQWHDETTGQAVEPCPMPGFDAPVRAPTTTAASTAEELVPFPCPLTRVEEHEPRCPCLQCMIQRAYERGKAEGGAKTVRMFLATDTDAAAFQHDHVETIPLSAPPREQPTQIPVPAPSPPAAAAATQARRRKQAQKQSSASDSTSSGNAPESPAPRTKSTKPAQQPRASPDATAIADPATAAASAAAAAAARARRDERDAMATSRAAYEGSVPATVRDATAPSNNANHSELAARWFGALGIPLPKDTGKQRLAFRARLRGPYAIEPIRAGIFSLLHTAPDEDTRRGLRPAFVVDAMRHDTDDTKTRGGERCAMLGFDKGMKTRPCTMRPRKTAGGERNMCNAHGLILKAICALVLTTVNTVRQLDLGARDEIVPEVLDALAEFVHWFAATAVYSNRKFSELEIHACTRMLVAALVDAHRAKALAVLSARDT